MTDVKVLVAEDDPVSLSLLETSLSTWGYEVVPTRTGDEAWEVLQSKESPLMAILDWMMPGIDGIEVCRRLRERKGAPYVYVVVVTAKDRSEDIVAGIQAGADDYLTKPVNLHELEARLHSGKRVLELQNALLASQEWLKVQATHDPLTGLWNRTWILEKLHDELARARRRATPVSVVLADIDHFKKVNDAAGHLAGDAVIYQVTQRIQNSVREYDTVGRYGGDEILVILPECDARAAQKMAERIRERICATPIATSEGTFRITASFGVATTDDWQGAEPQAVIRAADTALYRAKNVGRNVVACSNDARDFAAPRESEATRK